MLQEKPSALKREHPALINMNILYFFLFLWEIFALLDPDPDPATQINADPCGSGSTTLLRRGHSPGVGLPGGEELPAGDPLLLLSPAQKTEQGSPQVEGHFQEQAKLAHTIYTIVT